MNDFSLRPALKADFSFIKELIYLARLTRQVLDWERFVVAANPDGELIGCGQLKPHGREILELASITVHPNYRNLGVARAIIEHLLADGPRPLYRHVPFSP